MSFFRNIRSRRNKASARDSSSGHNSCSGSIASNLNSSSNNSVDNAPRSATSEYSDSILTRDGTFILNSDEKQKTPPPKSSTQKPSKKSKVLNKLSTFTKRMKKPKANLTSLFPGEPERYSDEEAANTYYKWNSDTAAPLDNYDEQLDPFHFLYEQHSSLKDMQNSPSSSSSNRNNTTISAANVSSKYSFDSSTYRKEKFPAQLKEELKQMKSAKKIDTSMYEDEAAPAEPSFDLPIPAEEDKFKTVTLNSLRKSFRDKYMEPCDKPSYSPAWFVDVGNSEPEPEKDESRESHPYYLEFDNENYRPSSRSLVRNRDESSKSSRSSSPVKRNETFRLERPSIKPINAVNDDGSSIHIEIKNSISPRSPGRFVPVGVAKPMPSSHLKEHDRSSSRLPVTTSTINKVITPIPRKKSPLRNWSNPVTVIPVHNQSARTGKGRYQTRVQIGNGGDRQPTTTPSASLHQSRTSTRIQLGPGTSKGLTTPGTRHSIATPTVMPISPRPHSPPPKNFGSTKPVSKRESRSDLVPHRIELKFDYPGALNETNKPRPYLRSGSSVMGRGNGAGPAEMTKKSQQLSGRLPSASVINNNKSRNSGHASNLVGVSGNSNNNGSSPFDKQEQRRARSPFKMPWR